MDYLLTVCKQTEQISFVIFIATDKDGSTIKDAKRNDGTLKLVFEKSRFLYFYVIYDLKLLPKPSLTIHRKDTPSHFSLSYTFKLFWMLWTKLFFSNSAGIYSFDRYFFCV